MKDAIPTHLIGHITPRQYFDYEYTPGKVAEPLE